MAEVIAYMSVLHSGTLDEFSVHVNVQPDGKAFVITSAGMLKPIIVMAGRPTTVRLRMPYTPDNQPLQLTVTREES
jgi:hypothetical protein